MNTFAYSPYLSVNATNELPGDFVVISSISKASGILSLSVWLFAQLPQVLENYLNQSVAGVSAAFLALWIAGDTTNLFGCVLTRALPFQTCLASYYCFIDLILSLQYWYYTKVYPRQHVHHNMLQSPDMMRPVVSNEFKASKFSSRPNRFEASPIGRGSGDRNSHSSERQPRRIRRNFIKQVLSGSVIHGSFKKVSAMPLDQVSPDHPSHEHSKLFAASALQIVNSIMHRFSHIHYNQTFIGALSAWCSTCFYIFSRTPQIWKNFSSKSTKGVSPYLFMFAMTGNILYTISVSSDLYLLANYEDYLGDAEFYTVFMSQLPFLIGSLGTVLFDAVILFQFWFYRRTSKSKHATPRISSHKHSAEFQTSTTFFTKPDWYTHTYVMPESENDVFYGGSNQEHVPFQNNSSRRAEGFQSESTFRMTENSSLSHDHQYIISPPSHYIFSSPQGKNGNSSQKERKKLSESISAFAKSSSTKSLLRSPSISSSYGSVPAGTSLIPSLVGTYSSYSRKMMNETKIPFSPIDFLHDDFLSRSAGSSSDQRG